MVVFTCNNCGEALQKPKVVKHYEFKCRSAPFLTCIDCLKDFRGEEYVTHTKCMTEAERYGGKDYVPKTGANKGEKKQQEWINIVNNVLNSSTNLSKPERSFLSLLSKYQNIPRKKAKFLNFVRSAMGQRVNQSIVDSVWAKMEEAYKNNLQSANEKKAQQNGKADEGIDSVDKNEYLENNVMENQNNENLDKEIQNGDQTKIHELNSTNDNNCNDSINTVKKKKSKKRTVSEIVQEEIKQSAIDVTEEPAAKKKKKHVAAEESLEKSKDYSPLDSSINQCDKSNEKLIFNWKDTILEIVKSKGEISLKKLQKNVISRYIKSCPTTVTQEKALSKFNKKMKKVSEIVLSDEKVKLA